MASKMKLVYLAFALACAPLIYFLIAVLPGASPAPLVLPAVDLDLAPALELVDLERARAEVASPAAELAAAEPTPLEAFLAARPGSPLALLPKAEASKYLATRESLVAWIERVDELDDVDAAAVVWNEELEFAWGVCQESQALYVFVVGHADRERARWLDRIQSVSLETELAPTRFFMDRYLGNTSEVWSLVSRYSDEVSERIHDEGEDAEDGDDEGSRWDLFRALTDAGAPSFDVVVELLRKMK